MDPFIGEVRLMGFAYDTRDGWMLCDGRVLQVMRYQALFSLLGNRYGGDGRTTFAIPDLRGRVGVHFNPATADYALGKTGGAEAVVLSSDTIATHTHQFNATTEAADKPAVGTSANRLLGTSTASLQMNGASSNLVAMNDNLSGTGGAQGHNNMQPSLVAAYYIATMGLYPSRP